MLFTSSPPPSLSLRSSPLPIISHNSLLVIKHHDICIPAKCHACGAKTWISHLLTPVLRFVTPGGNVWAITALTDTFWKILWFKETRTEERRSANSLYLVGNYEVNVPLCAGIWIENYGTSRVRVRRNSLWRKRESLRESNVMIFRPY